MAESIPMISSKVQLQPLPNFDFADPFIFSTEIIAAALAFVIAIYFYKFYRLSRFIYLLGLVIGFSLITFSEILLAIDVWQEFNPELFNLLFWLRFVSLSYGFSFIAVSYYFKHREEETTPLTMKIAGISTIPVMVMIAVIVILPPTGDLPPYNQVDEYFRVFNMVMLGYVFKSTLGSILEHGRRELMYIPAAYAVLWLGQFSALIFSIDGNLSNFIASHVAKVIGLALFVDWWYHVMKGRRVAKMEVER